MRARVTVAAGIGSACLLIFGTCETVSVTTDSFTIPQPVRLWMIGIFLSTVIVTATLAVLDVLRTVATRLDRIGVIDTVDDRVQSSYRAYERRARHDNVTGIYTEE
jgi:hypothetical protein